MRAIRRREFLEAAAAAGLGMACDSPAHRLPRANLITGSTGGDWYRIGSAIAEMTNEAFPGRPVTAVPGAGGVSNPARVGKMPGDFGISFGPFLRAAHRGEAPYREAFPDLRHVASLLGNKLHVIVADRAKIASLEQIVEQRLPVRLGTGPPGSGEEFLTRETLVALGTSYAEVRSWGGRIDLLGSGERADLFRDGHIDLIVFNMLEGSPLVTELLLSHPGRVIDLPDDVRTTLESSWGVRSTQIAAGRYAGQDAAVTTVGMSFRIFATQDVAEPVVYEMTRRIAEGKPLLENVHPGFKAWEPREMARAEGVPLHAGAERFYRERGWLDR